MAGLEKSWNGDVALATLQPAPVFPELYESLWLYSGSYASSGQTSSVDVIGKGTTGLYGEAAPQGQLIKINSNQSASTQYALEASLSVSSSSYTGYAQLYDFTSSAVVSGTQISTAGTTMSVIRSGKFALIPGHVYGVSLWTTGGTAYLTDASLIVFPSSPLTSPSVSAISLANPSGNTLKESYYPLWVYSSSYVSTTATSASGSSLLMKGGTSFGTVSNTATQLYSLSSSWSASQKFAFEASIWNNSTGAVYATLWDRTSNTQVSSSQVTVSTNTATLVRSGSFTLNPSHTYGVCIWTSAGTVYLTKSHLVALA